MKKLFIALFSVLLVAGFVYAAEEEASMFNFSGMINTRGTYIDNTSGTSDDPGDYMDYDMEFDGTLKITPTDQSLIYLNWEIQDKGFGPSPQNGSIPDANDDNIYFKRAYGSYDFGQGTSFDFGLMTGGAWGTAFGDNADGTYRLKVTHKADFGLVVGLVQKDLELGGNATGAYDAEKDDGDQYALAMVTKLGDITIMPLVQFVQAGQLEADEETDQDVLALVLAATGAFGSIGFEAEGIYKDTSYDLDADAAEDFSAYGLYFNGWTTMDALKVGAMVSYGSYDEDGGAAGTGAGFDTGADWGPGYWVMDWTNFGSQGAGYFASTMLAAYGSFSASDAMSFYGALEYIMSNEEDTAFEDATAVILNASMNYKLADNVAYMVGGAYGQIDGDTDELDPDPFTRLFHKITISF
jgi:hypothetical protein